MGFVYAIAHVHDVEAFPFEDGPEPVDINDWFEIASCDAADLEVTKMHRWHGLKLGCVVEQYVVEKESVSAGVADSAGSQRLQQTRGGRGRCRWQLTPELERDG
jgi:hypothetical protein